MPAHDHVMRTPLLQTTKAPLLTIRAYDDVRDRAEMTALYTAAWHAAYDAVDGAGTIDRVIAALLEGEPPDMFMLPYGDVALVAVTPEGAIVGGIRGHPRAGVVHLSGMYVAPPWLRRGVGRVLLTALLERFAPGTVIQTDVRPESASALAFYTRMGFGRIGSSQSSPGGGHWVDTVEMQMVLT
jgi:GNAT superfamily N-acetyltransferase